MGSSHYLAFSARAQAPIVANDARLIVFHFSDLHGQLRGHPLNGGGYARLAKVIKDARAKADAKTDVLVVYGGDAMGKGAIPCRKTEEKACVPLLKDLGIDVAVFGNGELKRSADNLNILIGASGIPVWVSPNVKATKGTARWVRDFKWKGAKTGAEVVIASWTLPPTPGEVDMKKMGLAAELKMPKSEIAAYAQRYPQVPVLWVPHQSWEDVQVLAQDLCAQKNVKSLAILQANTHEIRKDESHCLPIFEAGSFAEAVSRLEFKRRDGAWILGKYELVKLTNDLPEDPELKAKIEELYKKVAPEADEKLADVGQALGEKEVGQWFAEALKKVGKSDVAMVNAGAVKMGFTPGPLSRERLFDAIPYNNDVMGLDWKTKDFEKSLCAASRRARDLHEDYGSDLYIAGAQLVNAGTPDCRLEGTKKSSIKVVLESFLVRRSARWLGKDLNSIAFKFGMNTEQALGLVLKKEGVQL